MNNAELIKALRVEPFEVGSFGLARIMNQAADLIEAQQVDLRKANEIIEEGIRASRKSRAALETAQKLIAELEAQLPKEGEWIIHGEPPMLVIECSVCSQKYFNHVMQEKAKYCSMCGAKMEAQE